MTYKYYGATKNLDINFADKKVGLYLIITRYEIITVMRWSTSISAEKIAGGEFGKATITTNNFILNLSANYDIYVGVLSLN